MKYISLLPVSNSTIKAKILYQIVNNAVPNFENIDSLAKLIFLLSQEDVVITRALAKYTFECPKIIENGNTESTLILIQEMIIKYHSAI